MGMADDLGDLATAATLELEANAQTQVPSSLPLKPRVKRCQRLLHRQMKIGVSDGRFFLGKFHCLDKQGNIILYDTIECRETSRYRESAAESSPSSNLEQRNLGLVLIPARCRTSCLIEGSLDEQLSLLSLQDD